MSFFFLVDNPLTPPPSGLSTKNKKTFFSASLRSWVLFTSSLDVVDGGVVRREGVQISKRKKNKFLFKPFQVSTV